ncbi:DUF4326 domain-containing protein [Mycobacterium phage ThulaThula]|uniref:DUF4326 domain-containing protein n=1 Tax=Mycobacterium phage ThulaThula TaxID=2599880 RepID=A0A5J6TDU6_9CAUD|nr:DUF4326 domain-containing protein [Mycobacterium phage ThulaThula]QFG09093.1 hypothetical protein PBI_THULATHULA_65 [Mycobacterium phage ThulaThula]
MMPKRIQRRRTKGWRMPEGTIYVGRPTKWGNPWVVHVHTLRCAPMHALCPDWVADDRSDATTKYRHSLLYPLIGQPRVPSIDDIRYELRGRDLVCWCPLDQPCHADVLLEIANA